MTMRIQIFCLSLLLISANTFYPAQQVRDFNALIGQSPYALTEIAEKLTDDIDLARFSEVNHQFHDIAQTIFKRRLTYLWGAKQPTKEVINARDGEIYFVFGAKDNNIISMGEHIIVWEWSGTKYKNIRQIPVVLVPLYATFSPASNVLASFTDQNGSINVWNVETKEEIGSFVLPPQIDCIGLALSPDGQMLAAGSSNGIINIWNIKKREISREITAYPERVVSLLFSKDGKSLF